MLRDMKRRGMECSRLVVGDGRVIDAVPSSGWNILGKDSLVAPSLRLTLESRRVSLILANILVSYVKCFTNQGGT